MPLSYPLSGGLGAHEIYFSHLQLSHIDLVSQADEMLVDYTFYHFLNVALSCFPDNGIANAIVFKIELVAGLKYSLSVDVIPVHLVQDESLAKERGVVDDDC